MYDGIDHKWFVTRAINNFLKILVNVIQAND